MLRRCEPLYDGDPTPTCGRLYDDARRWTICPHRRLDQSPRPDDDVKPGEVDRG